MNTEILTFLISFFECAIVLHSSIESNSYILKTLNSKDCSTDAVWKNCSYSGAECADNCANYILNLQYRFCRAVCEPGCDPAAGYVFEKGQSGLMIPTTKCPSKCDPNMNWKKCSRSGAECADNCENYIQNSKFRFCKAVCEPGCDPTEEYVFSKGQSGDVIPIKNCPDTSKCGKNAYWNHICSYSGRGCARNCFNPCPDLSLCTNDCKPGCDPKDGFVFINDSSSDAVPVERCPFCKDNFDWKSNCSFSAAECADNCDNNILNSKFRFCKSVCEPGCDPTSGYVYTQGQSGDVVKVRDCPKSPKCGKNAHWNYACSYSGRGCAKNCVKPDADISRCTQECKPDCDPNDGFVFKYGQIGDAVKVEDCTKCDANTHWSNCSNSGSECADNCDNHLLNSKYHYCNAVCISGCDPNEGYAFVSGQSGDVIKVEDCKIPVCGKNSHWNYVCSFSGRGCTRNCLNPYPDLSLCTNDCKPGCDPLNGFVFINDSSSDAVPIERCPFCKDNFDWKSNCSYSAAGCADNCENYILNSKFRYCNAVCEPGCDPTEGFAFVNGQSGEVIKVEDCPKTPKCGNNSHWNYACSYSGRGCARNCFNPYPDLSLCTNNCKPGCDPNVGFVFINYSSSDAVPIERCPFCENNFDWKSNCSFSAAECADNCDNYVLNSNFRVCKAVCKPGCDPVEGFVFRHGQSGGVIKVEDCPAVPQCSENAYWNFACSYSGRGCARNCSNPHPDLSLCSNECKPGCDPKKGYAFRDDSKSKAIKIEKCPKCPPYYIWNNCSYTAAECADNCDNYVRNSKFRLCKAICEPGCDPAPGYVYGNGQSGEVIPISHCDENHECGQNTFWNHFCSYSGRGCERTCVNKNPDLSLCTQGCKPGCDPKEGYAFRDEEYPKSNAILIEKCPKCPPNFIWNECSYTASECADNCDNHVRNSKFRLCKAICVPGCDPAPGFVFEEGQSGEVIAIGNCHKPRECGRNAYWNHFCSYSASGCAKNCSNPNPSSSLCTQECKPGCDPKDGFVFLEYQVGDAIPAKECPKCPVHSHWNKKCSLSAAECADNCDNHGRNSKYRLCKAVCKEGCDPNEGFVFEKGQSGKVIPIIECPAFDCEPFTHWNHFCSASGRKCARNCIEQNNTENLCTQDCVPGCDPDDRHVFYSGQSGEAVPLDECLPNPSTMPAFEHFIYGVDITKYDLCPGMDTFKNLASFRGVEKSIFNFTYRIQHTVNIDKTRYIVPDQMEPFDTTARMGMSDYSTETIDSIRKLEETITASITVDSDFVIGKAQIGASYQQLKQSIEKENRQIVQSSRYIRSFEVNLIESSDLKNCLSNDFIGNMKTLTGTYETNPQVYEDFIQKFGTHYYGKITFGGIFEFRAYLNFFASHTVAASTIEAWAKVQVLSYSAETSSKVEYKKEFDTIKKNSNTSIFSCGGGLPFNQDKSIDWKSDNIDDIHRDPWPIQGNLIPISELIIDDTKKELHNAIFVKQAIEYVKNVENDLNQNIPENLVNDNQMEFYCPDTTLVISSNLGKLADSCCGHDHQICCFVPLNNSDGFTLAHLTNLWKIIAEFNEDIKEKKFNIQKLKSLLTDINDDIHLVRKQTCVVSEGLW